MSCYLEYGSGAYCWTSGVQKIQSKDSAPSTTPFLTLIALLKNSTLFLLTRLSVVNGYVSEIKDH